METEAFEKPSSGTLSPPALCKCARLQTLWLLIPLLLLPQLLNLAVPLEVGILFTKYSKHLTLTLQAGMKTAVIVKLVTV